MANVNKVILIGNLTRDIDMRYTGAGTAVGTLSLATNRTYKDGNGNKQTATTFIECTAWSKNAEILQRYTSKGHKIYIEGRLDLSTWDDKETGKKRNKLSVIIESFQFLNNKEQTQQHSIPQDGQTPSNHIHTPQDGTPQPHSYNSQAAAEVAIGRPQTEAPAEHDDIPF